MSETLLESVRRIHGKNRFFWGIVLADILIFSLLVAVFSYINFPGESFVKNQKVLDDFSLIIIIISLVSIMILKRNFLLPEKLIKKAKMKIRAGVISELNSLGEEHHENANLLMQILLILRRYYFLVWSLVNFVVLIGFIVFLLSNQVMPFLIYGAVGLYALFINFPFYSIVERCYYKISDES